MSISCRFLCRQGFLFSLNRSPALNTFADDPGNEGFQCPTLAQPAAECRIEN